MLYPRTIKSARRENRNHPYAFRQPEAPREPSNYDYLLPLFPAAGFIFGCLGVALYLAF